MNNYPEGAEFDSNAPYNQDSSQQVEEVEVTASNTLNKSATLELTNERYDSTELKREWQYQQKSAKQALDMAAQFAKRIYLVLKDTHYPQVLATLAGEAAVVFNACEGWYEDEFEVVMD